MSWKKYFKPVNSILPTQQKMGYGSSYASPNKFSSWLPEIYQGPPDRLQRYTVYETMNYDHEVHAALDTISDFSTEIDERSQMPFVLDFHESPSPIEVQILEKSLRQWVILNEFNKRLWNIFRSTLMYGDQFFIRDPETFKLYWCDPNKVTKAIVNESAGKRIEAYYIKNMDLNMRDLVATNTQNPNQHGYGSSSLLFSPPLNGNVGYTSPGYSSNTLTSNSFGNDMEIPVEAEHVVQLTLSDGMNSSWPFGISVLESVYKVYKQKELLEDAILIYRVHRAPERRVFFIDVGNQPPNKAQQYLERVRYEVQQKRIPSRSGGGSNMVDSTYSPMCLDMSTRVPLIDGRVMTIAEIADRYRTETLTAFSCNPTTGQVVPGKITWAGETKKRASVMELKFDNGKSLVCTLDHKFPVFGKGFVEAQNLTSDDMLISFETGHHHSETLVYDHADKEWKEKDKLVEDFYLERLSNMKNDLMSLVDREIFEAVKKDANIPMTPEARIRLVSATKLPSKMTVGTLTIEGDEFWHDYHTFAIESGVFVKNSMLEDYFFAVTCIHLDTEIPLLDGRTLTLEQLIDEHQDGKENYAYTVNQTTHELEPGKIVWAGVTRKDAQVLRVTLDNGESIVCTPDHRFILRDGSEEEAQNLKPGVSLMPLYLIEPTVKLGQTSSPYLSYVDNKDETIKWVHTAICPKSDPDNEWTNIFHLDSNPRNNNPSNLHEAIAIYDHVGKSNKPSVFSRSDLDEHMSQRGMSVASNVNINATATLGSRAPIVNTVTNPVAVKKTIRVSEEMADYVIEVFNQNRLNSLFLGVVLSDDPHFQKLYKEANADISRDKNRSDKISVSIRFLHKVAKVKGFDTWGDLKMHLTGSTNRFGNFHNHKVAAVEWLDDRVDTGDITIESKSGAHNFATAAGVYIHNSEGRGSKVETLPGGENLGCLALDTKIKIFDSEDMTINEIAAALNTDGPLWTYSCHPVTGDIALGQITWAGRTRDQADVMKITLSNGSSVICTLDHKFPIYGRGFVEAKDLTVGQQLIPAMVEQIGEGNLSYNLIYNICRDDWVSEDVLMGKIMGQLSGNGGDYITDMDDVTPDDDIGRMERSITAIEFLSEKMDVGTLSIDTGEEYHDFHTFALAAGVFTKNSIDDLRYFNNKMLRALGVPSSYLPSGPEDGSASYNDGRVGTAFIQEFRFSKVCERYQKQIIKPLDREFKLFLKQRGVTIDNSLFELSMTPPQSFSEYRQLELDAAKINVFSTVADLPYISKRFAISRYLGWTEEECKENERLWKEERKRSKAQPESEGGLADTGITPSGIEGLAPEGGFDEDTGVEELGADLEGDLDLEGEGEVDEE